MLRNSVSQWLVGGALLCFGCNAQGFVAAATATAEGTVSLMLVEAEVIRSQLPDDFQLDKVSGVPSNLHPILVAQTYLTNTRFRLGLIPFPAGVRYDEVIAYVPFVLWRGQRKLLYSNIYLNLSSARDIGRNYYSMNKQLGEFSSQADQGFAVRLDAVPIVAVKNAPARATLEEKQRFVEIVQKLLSMPMISELDGQVTCFSAAWKKITLIKPLNSFWTFSSGFWDLISPESSAFKKIDSFAPDNWSASAYLQFRYELSYPRSCN